MARLTILIWMMLGATLAGIFVIAVVSVPTLAAQDMRLIPYAAGAGFILAIPFAYWVAKKILAMTQRST